MREAFDRFALWSADAIGTAESFAVQNGVFLLWAAVGCVVGFSEVYILAFTLLLSMLTQDTATLIQNAQNRDTAEIKASLKEAVAELRELIRAVPEADERVIKEAEA